MIEQDLSFRKIENAGRLLVPQLLLLVLLLLNVVNLPFLPTGVAKPLFVLMAVYYWAIYRPTLIPPYYCFSIGLLIDVLTGAPPGITALVLVLTQWIVQDQRRFLMGQPYSTIWAVFGLVCAISIFVQWTLHGLIQFHWSPILPVLSEALVSMLLFPFVTMLLVITHRMLPVASHP